MAEFDIKKAREICENLPIGGGQTIKANIAFMRAYYPAGRMLPAALDEIERLRADNEILLNVVTAGDTNIIVNSKEQAKRIQELGAALIEPAKLMLTPEQLDALGEAISMIEDPCEDGDRKSVV